MEWDICNGTVDRSRFDYIQSCINVALPMSYFQCIAECDGGYPRKTDFQYFDVYSNKMLISGIGAYLCLNESDQGESLLEYYFSPPEFFPGGLVAFADTGGGDLICFDYRENKEKLEPAIVLWRHGADIGKDVSYVAKNFEEFLTILKEPEEEDY